MSLLPYQPFNATADQEGDLRVVGVDDDALDEVFSALASENARSILSRIYEEPATPSEIAAQTGNSVQTVSYHLNNLEDAGLIQAADVRYSEKGAKMDIYAPADEPVVVFVGTNARKTGFVDMLKRVIGATGILSLTGMVLYLYRGFGQPAGGTSPTTGVLDVPGVEFFLGGLFILSLLVLWWTTGSLRQS